MNFDAMQAVLAADLQPASLKLAAMVMAFHANKDTGHFWPSVRTLAAECSLSETQMKRVIGDLKRRTILRVVERSAGGKRTDTTVYELDLAQLRLAANPVHQRTPATDEPRSAVASYPGHWRRATGAIHDTGRGPSMDPKGEVKWNGTEPKSRRNGAAAAPAGRSAASRRGAIKTYEPEV